MKKNLPKSPNLLRQPVNTPFVTKHHKDITTVLKIIIVLVEAIFILTLGMNSKAKLDINALEREVDFLGKQLDQYNAVETETRDIITRTAYYQDIVSQRQLVGNNVEKSINIIPAGISIKSIKLNAEKASLKMTTNRPLQISALITKYLEDGFVKEIILETAILNKITNEFDVAMEISFND